MNFEKDDCLIDSLSNTNRESIVRLSCLRAKFANGASEKIFLFFFTSLRESFPLKKMFFIILEKLTKFVG